MIRPWSREVSPLLLGPPPASIPREPVARSQTVKPGHRVEKRSDKKKLTFYRPIVHLLNHDGVMEVLRDDRYTNKCDTPTERRTHQLSWSPSVCGRRKSCVACVSVYQMAKVHSAPSVDIFLARIESAIPGILQQMNSAKSQPRREAREHVRCFSTPSFLKTGSGFSPTASGVGGVAPRSAARKNRQRTAVDLMPSVTPPGRSYGTTLLLKTVVGEFFPPQWPRLVERITCLSFSQPVSAAPFSAPVRRLLESSTGQES